MDAKNENLGDINRITTILGMNDKRLLRNECINELVLKIRKLYKDMAAAHMSMRSIKDLKSDLKSYTDMYPRYPLDNVRRDFKMVLFQLALRKTGTNVSSKHTINEFLKLLQKED